MAIARLSVKVGKAGKAGPHADYIAREGEYASRLERGEALETKEAGNMPAWAADSPGRFWHAADAFERANGTTYRELELALPRELEPADRAALVREFVKQELGERHPYQWAIHRPKAADGQDQPHAHLMFSERRLDGIARDPSQFFRRYNAKAPEKGGAHKRFGEVDGPNRSQAQRAADLRALRGRWGEMVNDHLERAGVAERIDMRSLKDQGKDRAPEKKQLPSAWRDPNQRAVILEYRQINREQDQAAAEFRAVVPEGHVVDLETHRAKLDAIRADYQAKTAATLAKLYEERDANTARLEAKQAAADAAREQERAARQAAWQAEQPARAAAERERVALVDAQNQARLDEIAAGMTTRLQAIREAHAAKLAARSADATPKALAIEQPAPAESTAAPAQIPGRGRRHDFGQVRPDHQEPAPKALPVDPERVYETLLKPILERHQAAAQATVKAVSEEREQYREASRVHYYSEPTGILAKAMRKAKWDRDGNALAAQGRPLLEREDAARLGAEPAAIVRAAVEELRRVAPGIIEAAETAKRGREAREQERQRKEQAEKERTAVGDAFAKLAERREDRDFSFRDGAAKWKATPSALKERIEKFNSLPKHERPAALERINRNPATREQLKGLMVEREQAIKGRGQSR